MPQAATAVSAHARGKRSESYIPGLDGMRAVACAMVVFAHGLGRWGAYVPATLGVTIFFFLSGYLITTLLRREIERTGTIALGDFYIRRTLRIFAPLYVTYGVAVAVAAALHMQTGNVKGLLSMLFYFFNYANNFNWGQFVPHGMDVIWSLAVEEHFYLLFPVGMLLMARARWSWRKQAAVLLALCLADVPWRMFMTHQFGLALDWTYRATDSRFDSILWGSILALAFNPRFHDRPLVSPRWALPAFLGALAVLLATMLIGQEYFRQTLRYTVQSMALVPIFFFVIAHIEHPLVHWLERPAVRYLGWLSYVLYLSHAFIFSTVDHLVSGFWTTLVLGLALTLAYAVLIRYTLELPLQHLRARFRRVPESDRTAPDGHGLIS